MKIKNKWFTLIELMVVITIIWIIMTMVYAPYHYYTKKLRLRLVAKEISKTLSESRNLAIHWISETWSWNLSIWVYFDSSSWNNDEIKVFWYPYSYWTWSRIVINDPSLLIKEIKLQKNIIINKIEEKNKAMFFFEAISWKWYYFDFENSKQDLNDIDNNSELNIDFSYENASTDSLKKTLIYYTKTYISDY